MRGWFRFKHSLLFLRCWMLSLQGPTKGPTQSSINKDVYACVSYCEIKIWNKIQNDSYRETHINTLVYMYVYDYRSPMSMSTFSLSSFIEIFQILIQFSSLEEIISFIIKVQKGTFLSTNLNVLHHLSSFCFFGWKRHIFWTSNGITWICGIT